MISGNKNLSGALKRASIAMMVLAVLALILTAPSFGEAQVSERLREPQGPGAQAAPESGINRYPSDYEAQTKELEQATKPGTATKGDIAKAGCNIFSEGPGCVIYWVLDAVSDFIVTTFVSLAALAFDYVVQYAVNYDLAASAFVKTGFAVTIGVANMFFVLLLLWIAIATIFDFEPYTARSLLPKLIIAALLINFSLAIGKSFIRLSNGIAMIFYNNLMRVPSGAGEKFIAGTEIRIPGSAIAHRVMEMSNYTALIDASAKSKSGAQRIAELTEIVQKAKCKEFTGEALKGKEFALCEDVSGITAQEAQDAWRERFDLSQSKDDQATLLTAFQAILWKLAMVPVIIFVLLAGIIFIIIRELSLAFILVLGPMAFLFMILPATQRFYNQWWEGLAKWSFFLPVFMFFLFLSLRVGGGILPAAITSSDDRLPVMFQYLMTMALLIGSLIAANQMGGWSASIVTGWGKTMGKGVGKYVGGRGWKWSGRGTERFMETGVARTIGRIPVIGAGMRAAATAVMKKGGGVEKKDIEFYSKLPDRQLAATLSTMREGRARAFWEALPAKRRNKSAGTALGALARSRGWTGAPPAPQPLPTPQQAQNQAIQNQVMPLIRQVIQNLPQNIQSAMIDGIQQAIQNLPLGAQAPEVNQVIQQTVQDMERTTTDITVATPLRAASGAIQTQSTRIQAAVEQAQRIAARPPRPPTALREDLETEIEDLRGEIEELRERRT